MATRVERPYDSGRFYRRGAELSDVLVDTFGESRLSLAVTNRSGTVGFSRSEGWTPCSSSFAWKLRRGVDYSDVYADTYQTGSTVMSSPMWAVRDTWQANPSNTSVTFLDLELRAAGFTRPNGDPIEPT